MTNTSFMISVVFIVAVASNLSSCFIKTTVWTAVKERIQRDSNLEKYLEDIKFVLDEAASFNLYSTESFKESVEGGLVLDVQRDKKKFWAKLLFEEDHKFSKCENFKVFEKEEFNKIKYVQKMSKREAFTRKVFNKEDNSLIKEIHACIVIFEDYNININLKDTNIFDNDSIKHWPILFRFFGRLIQAVAEINFRAKLLHGDIRPENILLVVKKNVNPELMDVEPVIFNFDSKLEYSAFVKKPDQKLRYALVYRPPEMRQATTKSEKFSEGDWNKNWKNYEFSDQLVEDTYALGVTIDEVLKKQINNVNKNSDEYREFRILVDQMMSARYKEPYVKSKNLTMLRPSMKNVIWEFGLIISKCQICKTNTITKDVKDEIEAVSHSLNTQQGYI